MKMPPKPPSQSFFFTPLLLLFLLSTTLVTPLVTAQTHTRTSIVVVTVTATPTDSPSSSYTSREEFKDTILKVSNAYRKQHGASPLVWNETLAEYAFHYAKKCRWEHSVGFLLFSLFSFSFSFALFFISKTRIIAWSIR